MSVLLAAMWWEHRTPIALPTPTGPFAVGRTTVVWTRPASAGVAASDSWPGMVMAWLWYPARPGGSPSAYLPPAWRDAVLAHQVAPLRWFVKRDSARVRVHATEDAPVADSPRPFPLVLLRAGGSALATDFTALAEDLASHGYVVAGLDAPSRSFVFVRPDGTVVPRAPGDDVEEAGSDVDAPVIGRLLARWTADARFVTGELARMNERPGQLLSARLDVDRVGMVGHSFGGATALEFCREEPRCHAAADLDGIPFGRVAIDGAKAPALFLLSGHRRERDTAEGRIVLARIRAMYDQLPVSQRWLFSAVDAHHFSFGDQSLLNSRIATRLVTTLLGEGGLDPRRGLALTADVVRTFFDVTLRGESADAMAALPGRYRNLRIGAE